MREFVEAWREPATTTEQMRLVYTQFRGDAAPLLSAPLLDGTEAVGRVAAAARLAAFYVSVRRGLRCGAGRPPGGPSRLHCCCACLPAWGQSPRWRPGLQA